MLPQALGRWMLRTAIAEPAAWLLVAAAGVLGALLSMTSRFGVVSNWGLPTYGISQIFFLAIAVALAWASAHLGRNRWLLGELGTLRIFLCQAGVLLGTALFAQLLVGLALWGWGSSLPQLGSAGLRCAGLGLHWVALALALQQLPASAGSRPVLLLSAGWWLPALLVPSSDLGRRFHGLFDVGRHALVESESWQGTLADMTPAATWFLAAFLLSSGERREQALP